MPSFRAAETISASAIALSWFVVSTQPTLAVAPAGRGRKGQVLGRRGFELEPVPIASREVRERVARGEPIDDLVPRAVAAEIERLGLYRR